MVRWLKSLFAWRFVRDTGMWRYEENSVTGARRARQSSNAVYQPIDHEWLRGGDIQ